MGDILLITRPNHDYSVTYLYYWGKEILDFAKESNIRFKDFKGESANKKEVTNYLKRCSPKFVVLNGHGGPDRIGGYKNEPLIISNENDNLLDLKITYAIACDSALDLGKRFFKKEGTCFIGYEGPFGFVHDASRECNPIKDRLSIPFKDSSNEIVISLLKGKTAKEAYDKSQKMFSGFIKKYSTSDVDPEAKEIRFWLFWDKWFQKIIGDGEVKFIS